MLILTVYMHFIGLIFVAAIDYENIFTMKMSRDTIVSIPVMCVHPLLLCALNKAYLGLN